MSFPNYEKNYNVGNIRLDTPYTHFVYELPLLSFGDVLHTVNLSLVYQSKMSGNPYSIAPGFGLNLQKKLSLSQDDNPSYYESGNGEKILLNNCDGKYVFDDGSQRIIRGTILENPDFSTESFTSSGNISMVTDKHGNVVLNYIYDGSKLNRITFRPDTYTQPMKKIALAYNNVGNLERISYLLGTQVICTTNLVYLDNGGIKVQHYSGVDYYIIPTETSFTVYSRDHGVTESKNYYHSIECNISTDGLGNKAIVANSLVGTSVVDSVTYNFHSPINGKINVLDVTNFHGVTTRTRFRDDKPIYSFEVLEDQFDEYEGANGIFIGNVSIHSDGEIAGKQTVLDGIKMENVGYNHFKKEFGNGEMTAGNFLLSGWVMGTEEATSCNIEVRDSFYPEFNYSYPMQDLPPYTWVYFSFVFRATNPRELLGLVNMPLHKIMTNDFRLSLIEPITAYEPYHDNLTKMYDIFIDSSGSESIEIPFTNGVSFYIGSSETSIDQIITAKDILRYKINKAFGTHKNEIYYNDCKGVISTNEPLNIKYDDQTGERVTKNINDLEIGKKYCLHSNSYVTSTKTVDNSELVTSIWQGGKAKRQTFYNEKLDVTSIVEKDYNDSANGGVAILYIRDEDTGLITRESKWDYSTQQTVDTFTKYNDDCTELLTTTDEFGIITSYETDPTWGVVTRSAVSKENSDDELSAVTDAFDSDLTTQKKRIFENVGGLVDKEHSFRYSNGSLVCLSDGYNGYRFTYSNQGDLYEVRKNSVLLETHTVSNDRRNFTTDFGTYSFTEKYDKYGKLTEKTGCFKNTYDLKPALNGDSFSTLGIDNGSAKLASTTELVYGNETKFAYEDDKLVKSATFNSSDEKVDERTLTYDAINRVTCDKYVYDVDNSKYIEESCVYTTEATDPLADSRKFLSYYYLNDSRKASSTSYYDVFKRLSSKTVSVANNSLHKKYFYTAYRPNNVRYTLAGEKIHDFVLTYNERGQLLRENDYSQNYNETAYSYDSFGQLIRENDMLNNKTILYTYDNAGNIKSAKEYAYTTVEVTGDPLSEDVYVYDSIRTKLTSFNGGGITYNSDGCPLTYVKDGKTICYGWQKGKLNTISSNNFTSDIYAYDGYGRRVKKTHFTTTEQRTETKYTYDHSGRLIRETWGNKEIVYLYDDGDVVGMVYNSGNYSREFSFVKNLRGDVIGIYDSNGNVAAKYAYDAWGNYKIIDATDNEIASINRILYRSYYYDHETGLYYLNARYYNPEWRRFISPSTSAINPSAVNGLNPYAFMGSNSTDFKHNSNFSGASHRESIVFDTIRSHSNILSGHRSFINLSTVYDALGNASNVFAIINGVKVAQYLTHIHGNPPPVDWFIDNLSKHGKISGWLGYAAMIADGVNVYMNTNDISRAFWTMAYDLGGMVLASKLGGLIGSSIGGPVGAVFGVMFGIIIEASLQEQKKGFIDWFDSHFDNFMELLSRSGGTIVYA